MVGRVHSEPKERLQKIYYRERDCEQDVCQNFLAGIAYIFRVFPHLMDVETERFILLHAELIYGQASQINFIHKI